MNDRRYRNWMNKGAVLLTLVALVVSVIPATMVQAQGLLTNGGFESAHGDGISLTAPPGWQVWSDTTEGLVGRQLVRGTEVTAASGVYQGNGSFDAYRGWAAYNVAIYQTVSGIQPGSTVRATAFGRMWSCDSDVEADYDECISDGDIIPQSNTGASFRVGIDPTGSGNPNAGGIVWSTSTAPYTGFQQMSVDAQATGDRVTIVLYAGQQQPARHQHVFWDAASLEVVAGGTTTNPDGSSAPAPTAVPAPAIAAVVAAQAPQADGGIVHTVRSGDTLSGIAVAYGLEISQLLELNGLTMATARILSPGQELLVSEGSGEAPPADDSASSDAGSDGGEDSASEGGDSGNDAAASESSQFKPIEAYDDAPVVADVVPVMAVESSNNASVCVMLFDDANPNRFQESGEALLPGGQVFVTQSGASVGSYTTDGANEPYCFGSLAAGDYLVVLVPPVGYGVTTSDTFEISVGSGESALVAYGAAQNYVPPQAPSTGAQLMTTDLGNETDITASGNIVLDNLGYIVLGLAGVVMLGGLGLALLLRR